MTQKLLKKFDVVELKATKLEEINGGEFWPAFWASYALSEIINGIQEGLKTDCSEFQC